MNAIHKPIVAIIGGTGALGSGLATRWAEAGYDVIIGSRSLSSANAGIARIRETLSARGIHAPKLRPMENEAAAAAGEIAVLTVPYSSQKETLEQIRSALRGKVLVDVTVPLAPPKAGTVHLPPEGSAGQAAQALLGEDVQVVSAFQNVAAHHLHRQGKILCDVLVCGNRKDAREIVIALVEAAGMRGFHAGPIENAAVAEAMTSVLITMNRQYKCHAGIMITGLEE